MNQCSFIDSLVQWGLGHIEIYTDEIPEEVFRQLRQAVDRELGIDFSILICMKYHKELKGMIGVEEETVMRWCKEVPVRIGLESLRRKGLVRFNKPIYLFPNGKYEGGVIPLWKEKSPFLVY